MYRNLYRGRLDTGVQSNPRKRLLAGKAPSKPSLLTSTTETIFESDYNLLSFPTYAENSRSLAIAIANCILCTSQLRRLAELNGVDDPERLAVRHYNNPLFLGMCCYEFTISSADGTVVRGQSFKHFDGLPNLLPALVCEPTGRGLYTVLRRYQQLLQTIPSIPGLTRDIRNPAIKRLMQVVGSLLINTPFVTVKYFKENSLYTQLAVLLNPSMFMITTGAVINSNLPFFGMVRVDQDLVDGINPPMTGETPINYKKLIDGRGRLTGNITPEVLSLVALDDVNTVMRATCRVFNTARDNSAVCRELLRSRQYEPSTSFGSLSYEDCIRNGVNPAFRNKLIAETNKHVHYTIINNARPVEVKLTAGLNRACCLFNRYPLKQYQANATTLWSHEGALNQAIFTNSITQTNGFYLIPIKFITSKKSKLPVKSLDETKIKAMISEMAATILTPNEGPKPWDPFHGRQQEYADDDNSIRVPLVDNNGDSMFDVYPPNGRFAQPNSFRVSAENIAEEEQILFSKLVYIRYVKYTLGTALIAMEVMLNEYNSSFNTFNPEFSNLPRFNQNAGNAASAAKLIIDKQNDVRWRISYLFEEVLEGHKDPSLTGLFNRRSPERSFISAGIYTEAGRERVQEGINLLTEYMSFGPNANCLADWSVRWYNYAAIPTRWTANRSRSLMMSVIRRQHENDHRHTTFNTDASRRG